MEFNKEDFKRSIKLLDLYTFLNIVYRIEVDDVKTKDNKLYTYFSIPDFSNFMTSEEFLKFMDSIKIKMLSIYISEFNLAKNDIVGISEIYTEHLRNIGFHNKLFGIKVRERKNDIYTQEDFDFISNLLKSELMV